MSKLSYLVIFIVIALVLVGCATDRPRVVVITSTAMPVNAASPVPDNSSVFATDSPTQIVPTQTTTTDETPDEYIVQAGDTLSQIATNYNVNLQALINANQITNPNLLEVGQVLVLPAPPTTFTPSTIIVPDSRLVLSADSVSFDLNDFLSNQAGYIQIATDTVDTRLADGSVREDIMPAVDVIKRVAMEYSVDERLLVAFLEYKAQWLTNPDVSDALSEFPLISEENSAGFDRAGLYKQLSWLANELNRGYYSPKYRNFQILTFSDGTQLLYNQSINSATIALQYVLSLNNSVSQWQVDVTDAGFRALYSRLFGIPDNTNAPLATLSGQPPMTLPFRSGDVWRFTGGFHGGWGSGSAWSALDFAPPDDRQDGDPFCYISEYPVTAVADGVIARNSNGALILDLDKDGNEKTGWTVLYLHMTIDPAISVGQAVNVGDTLGNASCFGGFSTATHLHIARRYNGEWIPADCNGCENAPPFVMSDWQAVGLVNQEYQGYMINVNTNDRVVAEQGRNVDINEISW